MIDASDRDRVLTALESLAQFGIPTRGAARLIDIGTSDYLRFVRRELLDEFVATGASTCRVYEGPYGTGKTHLLQLLEDEAREAGFVVVRADLSQAMGFDTPGALVRYLLENVTRDVRGDRVRSLPSILHESCRGLSAPLPERPFPHQGFAAAMRYAARNGSDGEASVAVRRFLLGERVSTVFLRRLGATGIKGPLSDRNAEQVLRTVTMALYAVGIPGTVILFDETEPTLGQHGHASRKMSVAANLMRRLIDQSVSGSLSATLTVFAVLPGFIDQASAQYPALGQRLRARVDPTSGPWRMPTLRVEQATTIQRRDTFVDAAVTRFVELAGRIEVGVPDLERRLAAEGQAVLQTNAGGGYRRELMKRLATVVLAEA